MLNAADSPSPRAVGSIKSRFQRKLQQPSHPIISLEPCFHADAEVADN